MSIIAKKNHSFLLKENAVEENKIREKEGRDNKGFKT